MPLYTYECSLCEWRRTDMRLIAERNDGPTCDICGEEDMKLVINAVPGIVKNPAVPRSK